MRLILWFLIPIVCLGCNKAPNIEEYIHLGDLSFKIDTVLFSFKDTIFFDEANQEIKFRKIIIKNNSTKDILLGSYLEKYKLVRGWPRLYYQNEIKSWNSRYKVDYTIDTVFFSIPKYKTDTFAICDPFRQFSSSFDTINFEIGYYINDPDRKLSKLKIERIYLFKNKIGQIVKADDQYSIR